MLNFHFCIWLCGVVRCGGWDANVQLFFFSNVDATVMMAWGWAGVSGMLTFS